MSSTVSRSNAHFGFERSFFACPIGRQSEIAQLKNRVQYIKFIYYRYYDFCQEFRLIMFILFATLVLTIVNVSYLSTLCQSKINCL